MTMTRWIAIPAAASLAAAPVAAQAARTSAPVHEAEALGGPHAIAWILAAIMVIGAILIITDNDDEGAPHSP